MNFTKFAFAFVALFAVSTVSAATIAGAENDGNASLAYDFATGEFAVQVDGNAIGLIQVLSESSIFTGSDAVFPAGGLFTTDADNELGWAALSGQNADFSLGIVAAPGIPSATLLQDLTILFSGGFGTANFNGDLVVLNESTGMIPEPTTALLAALGLCGFAARRRV